jgi:hypothetical protein
VIGGKLNGRIALWHDSAPEWLQVWRAYFEAYGMPSLNSFAARMVCPPLAKQDRTLSYRSLVLSISPPTVAAQSRMGPAQRTKTNEVFKTTSPSSLGFAAISPS